MRYADIWPRYAGYWDKMTINADAVTMFNGYAQYAMANNDKYNRLATATGLPWAMIACIHRRESDANFSTYLGNGQSLLRVTTEVPKGRGPFPGPDGFQNGGLDAIKVEGWGSVQDWRVEKQLYYMMLFNGPGYEMHGLPSPYIWGLTNIQRPGKYVRDGVFDSSVIDTQPGCAPLLKTIASLDPTVTFTREN